MRRWEFSCVNKWAFSVSFHTFVIAHPLKDLNWVKCYLSLLRCFGVEENYNIVGIEIYLTKKICICCQGSSSCRESLLVNDTKKKKHLHLFFFLFYPLIGEEQTVNETTVLAEHCSSLSFSFSFSFFLCSHKLRIDYLSSF